MASNPRTYQRVIHVAPQDISREDYNKIVDVALPLRQGIVQSWDDAVFTGPGPHIRPENVRIIAWNIPEAQREAFRQFVATHNNVPEIPIMVEFRSTLAPALPPVISLRATPTTTIPGGTSRLEWEVTGATKVLLNGSQVDAKGSRVVMPATTTDYTIAAEWSGGTKSMTVTVVVTSVQPPPILTYPKLGFNILYGERETTSKIAATNPATCSFTFNPGAASRFAREHPNALVICRPEMFAGNQPISHPSAELWAIKMELTTSLRGLKNVWGVGANEEDHGFTMIERSQFDRSCWQLARANGINYAIESYSVGTWDHTSHRKIVEYAQHYGRLIRDIIAADGVCYINIHLYQTKDGSTVPFWERWERQYDIELPNHEETNDWPSAWGKFTIRGARQTIWTAERWRLLVVIIACYCGVDPNKLKIICDETGVGGNVDMPPVIISGGMKANNFTLDEAVRWGNLFVSNSAKPTTYTYQGVTRTIPSNLLAAQFFVANGGSGWAGDEMMGYLPALSTQSWWKP